MPGAPPGLGALGITTGWSPGHPDCDRCWVQRDSGVRLLPAGLFLVTRSELPVLFPTLMQDYLSVSARRTPDKVALICGEERLTHASLDRRSDHLASALLGLGARCQDRVAVFLDTSCETVLALYAILKAGCVFVILDGTMKAAKLRRIVEDSGTRTLITHTDKASVVTSALGDMAQTPKVVWVGASEQIPEPLRPVSLSWDSLLAGHSRTDDLSAEHHADKALPRCIDQDLAAIIYTSGSTGQPKGVMVSHHNMIAAAESVIEYLRNEEQDVILNVLPLSFGYGLYQVLMAIMFGGTVVLGRSFVFLHEVLGLVAHEGVTGFPIVPTIAAMLLRMRDLSKYDLSTVKYITSAGAALPVDHMRRLRALLPHVALYSMYGLTECKRVSYLPPEELDRRPSSVGVPMPNCEAFIVDEAGRKVAPGVVGELVVRGSNVARGYWNDPALTAKAFRPGPLPGETLLHTGDLFTRDDDGFLYFVGREDDMIKVSAERVSPREVEDVLCEIDGVSEAAAMGVPDEILGQAIKAFVVRDAAAQLTEADVLKYCSDHLQSFMVPKSVQWAAKLPRDAHGKLDKNALRGTATGPTTQ